MFGNPKPRNLPPKLCQQEARKRLGRPRNLSLELQGFASKRPGRGQRRQEEARKRPGRGQEEACKPSRGEPSESCVGGLR